MTTITIQSSDLRFAAAQGLINEQQVGPLWEVLSARATANTRLTLPSVAFYGGALLLLIGMAWLLVWSGIENDGSVLFFLSFLYFIIFYVMGLLIWFRPFGTWDARIPKTVGGISVTLGVSMVWLIVIGLQMWIDWFPERTPLILAECITLIVGLITIALVWGFPLLIAPVFFSLWALLTVDLENLLFGDIYYNNNYTRPIISALYGALILASAQAILVWHQRRLGYESVGQSLPKGGGDEDTEQTMRLVEGYAFWAFIFGTFAFWEGLTFFFLQFGWVATLIYLLINVAILVGAVYLRRIVLLVFGGVGVFLGIFDLVGVGIFGDLNWLVAIGVSIAGLITIGLGVLIHTFWYQKPQQGYEEIEDREEGLPVFIPRTFNKAEPYGQEMEPFPDKH